jgi:uncharacterized membrane protein
MGRRREESALPSDPLRRPLPDPPGDDARERGVHGRSELLRTGGRWALAGLLALAGVGHFLVPEEFLGQVPPWVPAREAVVYVSGVVELLLAVALVALPRHRVLVGWVVAAFFVVIFPGNVSQAVTGADAFGLDTPLARWTRLAFQPVLVVWALWATGAWRAWRDDRTRRS